MNHEFSPEDYFDLFKSSVKDSRAAGRKSAVIIAGSAHNYYIVMQGLQMYIASKNGKVSSSVNGYSIELTWE